MIELRPSNHGDVFPRCGDGDLVVSEGNSLPRVNLIGDRHSSNMQGQDTTA